MLEPVGYAWTPCPDPFEESKICKDVLYHPPWKLNKIKEVIKNVSLRYSIGNRKESSRTWFLIRKNKILLPL